MDILIFMKTKNITTVSVFTHTAEYMNKYSMKTQPTIYR